MLQLSRLDEITPPTARSGMEKLDSSAPTGYDVGNRHSSSVPQETFIAIPMGIL